MSGLRLTLKVEPRLALDLSGLTPRALAKLSVFEISSLKLGNAREAPQVGDVFHVAGGGGHEIVIDGGSAMLDNVGAELGEGMITVDGAVGQAAGRGMRGGQLDIRGNAGSFAAAGLSGGVLSIGGNAGAMLGAALPGARFGLSGGIVHVGGSIGERAGDRMRKGTIVCRGACGANAGSRMMGGTIWAEEGFGEGPGALMRRGSLIGPSVARVLPTFFDCGRHDLVIMRIVHRYLEEVLGDRAPARALTGGVRRLAGDLATIGRGEILLFG